jgi:hypothetical protein
MKIPEVVALGPGIGDAGGADLPDFVEKRGIGLGGIAEIGPVLSGSAFDDVVDGGKGIALRMDVPMEHLGLNCKLAQGKSKFWRCMEGRHSQGRMAEKRKY